MRMKLISAALLLAAIPVVAGPLTQLHDALRLSPDQERAWSGYAAATRPSAQMQARHAATARLLPGLTTPRRLALIQADRTQDAVELGHQAQVVSAFYARLTPEQQAIFDRQTLPPSDPRNDRRGSAEPAPAQTLRLPPSSDQPPAP